MYPNQDKVDQEYRNSIYSSVLEKPNTTMTPVHGSAPLQGLPNTFLSSKTPHVSAFRLNSKALIITVSVLSLLAVGGIGLVVLKSPKATTTPNSQYSVGNLPLNGVQSNSELLVGKLDQLTINGLLQANNTLILNPTITPTTPVIGQIYYDSVTNQPYFYNGTKFVSLNPTTPVAGTSLGGLTGAIGLGQGLTVAGNQLGLASSFTSSLVTSLTGTANQVNVSGNIGNIKLSLPQDLAVASTPSFVGLTVNGNSTTTGNHTVQGQLAVAGTSTFNDTATFDGTAKPIGPELVTNGTFTGNAASWTLGPDVTFNPGTNNITSAYAGGDASLTTSFNTVTGNTYQIKFDILSANAPMQSSTQHNNGPMNNGPFRSGSITQEFIADFTGSDTIILDDYNYNTGDTWTLDNVSIKQVTNIKPALSVIGSNGNSWLTLGNDLNGNTALGESTLQSNATGYSNTAIGSSVLRANTVGVENTANGYKALSSNIDGSYNAAIGSEALQFNTTGTGNVAAGSSALQSNTIGYYNTAMGFQSLANNTVGSDNIASGFRALQSNTIGNGNTAVGSAALQSTTTGGGNVATGLAALYYNVSGMFNVATGFGALHESNVGSKNIALGYYAGMNLTTGSNNIALGASTSFASSTSDNQLQIGAGISGDLALGTLAVKTVGGDSATAFQVINSSNKPVLTVDTAIPQVTIQSIGTYTTFDTIYVDTANSIQDFNSQWYGNNWTSGPNFTNYNGGGTDVLTNIGFSPIPGDTYQVTYVYTGCNPGVDTLGLSFGGVTLQYPNDCVGINSETVTAITSDSMSFTPNATYTGTVSSVAIQKITKNSPPALTIKNNSGSPTLEIRSSSYNSFIGLNSGTSITSGNNDNTFGLNTLQNDTTGSYNVAIGNYALQNNTTGSFNSATGNGALQSNTTGYYNNATGYLALVANTTGGNNVAYGNYALIYNTNGAQNTALGTYALSQNTTGSYNLALGYGAGNGLQTGSSNVIIGQGAQVADPNGNNQLQIGAGLSGDLALGTLAVTTIGGNSMTAFQVKNSLNTPVLTVDTTNSQVAIKGKDPVIPVGSVAVGGYPFSVVGGGNYAYVVNFTSNVLQVFDVSNPAIPTLAGTVATYANPVSVAVNGNYVYVVASSGSSPLQVFDVSNPAAPTPVGSVDTYGYPWSIAVSGNGKYAYLASSAGGLVFDISNPASPSLAGSFASPYSVSVAVSGNYLYTGLSSGAGNSLQVSNISNPATPTLSGSVATDTLPISVAVSGNYAYVGSQGGNVQIFDVTNHATPALIGTVNSGSSQAYVAVSGNYAYIANASSSTLQIFNVANPAFPTLTGTATTVSGPVSVTVSGNRVSLLSNNYLQVIGTNIDLGTGLNVTNNSTIGGTLSVNNGSKITGSTLITGSLKVVGYDGSNQLSLGNDNYKNVALGDQALQSNTTGYENTATGAYALANNTSGYGNVADGYQALLVNTSGVLNVALGHQSLMSNTTGYVNDSIGYLALQNNTTGDHNNALGNTSLQNNTTGSSNNAVGAGALHGNITGYQNSAFGNGALFGETTGHDNIGIGTFAGANLTTGANNIALGTGVSFANSTADNQLQIGAGLSGDLSAGTLQIKTVTNSVSAFVIQDTSANTLFTANTSGLVITVSGTPSKFATLTLTDSHFKSTQTNAPTIGTPTNCGVTPTASVTAGSTDTAGSFVITAGTGVPATCDTVFSFNKAYGAAPKSVVISSTKAVGSATAERAATVSAASANNFTLKVNAGLTGNTPAASEVISYYYFVVE